MCGSTDDVLATILPARAIFKKPIDPHRTERFYLCPPCRVTGLGDTDDDPNDDGPTRARG